MFLKLSNPARVMRFLSAALLTIVLATLLAACGDATATTAPVATTVAATTARATTAAASTTVAATTASGASTTAAVSSTTAAVSSTTAARATTGAAGLATAVVGSASTAPKISLKELKFGAIPAENATKVLDDTKPFAEALSKELGIPVKLTVGTNYTAVIEALSSGQIDVAWFGPFSYVLASSKYNAEAIALQIGSNGATSYESYIISTSKTGIKTLADLKGRTFSFVDPASTSGNLIPRFTMFKNGLDPDKDVKGTFAGGHDASLLGVISGKTDAGAVASDTYEKLIKEGKIKDGEVNIVSKSDPIPNSPIAVRKELSANDKAAIRAAFTSIKDPAVLKSLNVQGFQETSDSTYNVLRDIATTLKLDLTKLK